MTIPVPVLIGLCVLALLPATGLLFAAAVIAVGVAQDWRHRRRAAYEASVLEALDFEESGSG